jgi:uncharacterized GH25 family protein
MKASSMKSSNTTGALSGAPFNSRAAFIFGLLFALALTANISAAQTTQTETNTRETVTTTNAVETAKQEAVKANSVVRGRAVYDDTGRPVRRARVMLLEANRQGPESIGMTNASGEFQIKNVPAGSYFVMVDAAGIITPLSFVDLEDADNDKVNIEEIKKHFEEVVVDGTNDVTVKVRARRGGAISGKVTYADGDPAINVRVNVLRKKDGRIGRFITNLNAAMLLGIQTDDRGMYRISGLPPGEYIISASETIDHSGDGRNLREDYLGMSGSSSLVVTYYEGATKQSSATAIQVEAGQEQNEINVTLVERALHTLSGTVVARRDNMPLRGAQITINSKNEMSQSSSFPFSSTPTAVATDEQGRFTFNEIPDGVYTLAVEPPYTDGEGEANVEVDEEQQTPPAAPTSTATPKRKFTRKIQEVTVSGGDLTEVAILLSEGASVSGTMTVEGGKPLPPEAQAILIPANANPVGDGQDTKSGSIQPDGTFTIDGISAGNFYPYVMVSLSDQYYVKSATVNGADLMRDPLVVGESATISDVRVVISPDAATLSGHILTGSNTPANGAQIVLITTDQSKWRARTSYLYASSKEDGSYSTHGAPGDYLIITLQNGEQLPAVNEAWIRSRAANAQRVTLLPREHKSLDLTAPAQ